MRIFCDNEGALSKPSKLNNVLCYILFIMFLVMQVYWTKDFAREVCTGRDIEDYFEEEKTKTK